MGIHHNTAFVLDNYTTEEVGVGLIPVEGFEIFVRAREALKYPPRQVTTVTSELFIRKSSFQLQFNGSFPKRNPNPDLPESSERVEIKVEPEILGGLVPPTKMGVSFAIDTLAGMTGEFFWGVPKTEINLLKHELVESMEHTPGFNVRRGFLTQLRSLLKSGPREWLRNRGPSHMEFVEPEEGLELSSILKTDEEHISNKELIFTEHGIFSPKHFLRKSPPIQFDAGISQQFRLSEDLWVTLDDEFIHATDCYPLVMVFSSSNPNKTAPGFSYLVVIQFTRQTFSEQNQLLELDGTIESQMLLGENFIYELQEVFGIDGDDIDCVVCLTDEKDTILLPCNHFAVCRACFERLDKCPICRTKIQAFLRFRSSPTLKSEDSPEPGSTEIHISDV